jgi:dTDP-4-amino-4,6-dideoxygalactose transaminase
MKVKFAELGIDDQVVLDEVETVLRSGRFIGGPVLDEFAERWAEICGTDYCVPVASGSAAITASIKALVPPGGAVLLPALSFAATAFSVIEAGCEPIYVDVRPDGLMNLDVAEEAVHRMHISCVLSVHLYGQLLDIEYDSALYNTVVIEDACQAHGVFKLQGDAGCFSFYPSKNLGAAGDAGAVVTNGPETAERIATYINYGDPPGRKYAHVTHGTNARMDAIQAAVLCSKLGKFKAQQFIREKVADAYLAAGIKTLATQRPTSWHVYPLLVNDRDAFLEGMGKASVECSTYYPYTLPDVVEGSVYGNIDGARFIANRAVALPIGPHMDSDQVIRVINAFFNLVEEDEVDSKTVWRVKDAY